MSKKIKLDETLANTGNSEEMARLGSEDYSNDYGRTLLHLDPKKDDLVFQVTHLSDCEEDGNQFVDLYGVAKDGCPVVLMADDFHPYFHIHAPKGFGTADCDPLKDRLKHIGVLDISLVNGRIGTVEASVAPFLKIIVQKASQVAAVKGALSAESQVRGANQFHPLTTYGSTVPFLSRFMADMKISPMTWLRVPAGCYQITAPGDKVSSFAVEAQTSTEDIKVLTEAQRRDLGLPVNAPLRVLSFDIETMVPADHSFPHPSSESVIQISCVVARRYYLPSTTDTENAFFRCVFTLGSCADIPGCKIFSFATEGELLMAWRKFVVEMDPDLVMGHNILKFDFPFLILRAEKLNLGDFKKLGRLADVDMTFNHPFQDRTQDGWAIAPFISGRITVDLMHWAFANIPYGQRKLDTLAREYLGDEKESVGFQEISGLQMGTADTRKRLAEYCLKDSELVLQLVDDRRCVQGFYVPKARQHLLTLNSVVSTVAPRQLSELSRLKQVDGGYLIHDARVTPLASLNSRSFPPYKAVAQY